MLLSFPINFSRTFFCSCKNDFFDYTSFFCSSVKFSDCFNSLYQSSVSSYSFWLNKCFYSEALHIMYRCKAGKLKFTIWRKYSFIVLILSFPAAPILYRRLSIIELISLFFNSKGRSLFCSTLYKFLINWCLLAVNPLMALFWFITRSR